jgi:toxin YoeB
MAFHLDFTDQAKRDIEWHKKSGNKAVLNKLFILLNELMENPFEGTGKPEPLKHQLSGCWSRIILNTDLFTPLVLRLFLFFL